MTETANARKSIWLRKLLWLWILLALFIWWWVAPTLNKARLDAQVRERCAKDGGIKVYETVILPPDKFDKYGFINFYRPTQGENALGPEYVFKEERIYYRRNNPDVWRVHNQIFRRTDEKLLGEEIVYIRRGGDPIGPWNDSSYTCPDLKDMGLIEKVFSSPERNSK